MESEPREIRLEGLGLVVAGLGLCALLGGAFWLGREVERSSSGTTASGEAPREEKATEKPIDVETTQDFFDRSDRPGQALEPGREVQRKERGAPTAPGSAPALAPGRFLVQVWAGRDRPTGERLVGSLQAAGYGVRMYAESSGGDTLYKVRVGGYDTEAKARDAVEDLKTRGYRGAWVSSSSP
jgi:cell division protein FtsN